MAKKTNQAPKETKWSCSLVYQKGAIISLVVTIVLATSKAEALGIAIEEAEGQSEYAGHVLILKAIIEVL